MSKTVDKEELRMAIARSRQKTMYRPNVIMNTTINHDKVEEYRTATLGHDDDNGEVNSLIKGGWKLFRIHTEWRGSIHVTIAFFAKMKYK